MKNRILLCALLSFGSMVTPTAENNPSAEIIVQDAVKIAKNLYPPIKGCVDFVEGESDDKAPLIKTLEIASLLLPEAKEFIKSKIDKNDENAEEAMYNYEKDIEPQIKMGITFLKGIITNPKMSTKQLREMLQSYVKMFPGILNSATNNIN